MADARRLAAIQYGLALLSLYAPKITMKVFRSSDMASTLRKMNTAESVDITKPVKDLVSQYSVIRKEQKWDAS